MKLFARLMLVFFSVLAVSCQSLFGGDDFGQGHDWIVPRPAAELHFTILDEQNTPLAGATGWLLFGGEKLDSADRLPTYDPVNGMQSDVSGQIIVQYLGESGGGYEVPSNASGPPKLTFQVESPDGKTMTIDLDVLLYRSVNYVGETSVEYEDTTIKLHIIEQTITFGAE
jgi:hypothetical protein